jgi:hypothetical protein
MTTPISIGAGGARTTAPARSISSSMTARAAAVPRAASTAAPQRDYRKPTDAIDGDIDQAQELIRATWTGAQYRKETWSD